MKTKAYKKRRLLLSCSFFYTIVVSMGNLGNYSLLTHACLHIMIITSFVVYNSNILLFHRLHLDPLSSEKPLKFMN